MNKKIIEGVKCRYCTVKRRGHTEEFDGRKIYASCYAACLSSHVNHLDAEQICEKVSSDMEKWAKKKKAVKSDDIFKKMIATIKKHNKDAAFMYETHRDIS